MFRALLASMIVRLDEDEGLMRDLIREFKKLDSEPEFNTSAWRELHGIPFD